MKLDKNDVVLFSGDSITDGNRGKCMDCNHIMGHGFQYIIASKLALENAENMPKFINKGYSGENAVDLFDKWYNDVIINRPTVLSILVGVNEGTYGYFNGLSPEQAKDRYETGLRAVLEFTRKELGDIKIILCEPFYCPLEKSEHPYEFTPHPESVEGPFERPDTNDPEDSVVYRLEVNKKIRDVTARIAEDFGCVFVPLYDKIMENAKRSKTEYFIWDGTHPTIAGHMLIAEEWFNALDKS